MQHKENFCFVALPFGKLLPSINKICGFLSMQRHNWTANWIHACDTADYNSILALTMLLNEWRLNEIYYCVPKSNLKYHTKHHYANHICNVLCLLTKNKNSVNYHVQLILVEILNFYYLRFQTIEVFITFGDLIDEMVIAAQKFVINYSIRAKENIKELLNYPEIHIIGVNLATLIDFLGEYDENGSKTHKSVYPSPQSLKQATKVIETIMEFKCMAQLLSALTFIKTDLVIFFELQYEKQLGQYRQKAQLIIDKKNAQNRKQMNQFFQKYPEIAQTNIILHQLKKITSQGTLTFPLFQIRKIINSLSATGIHTNIFFAKMTPLFRYLPTLVTNCTSQPQQIQVYQKIIIPIIELLSKVFEDKLKNIFSNQKKLSQFNQMDILRAFSDTSFLDELEATLITQFESKIHQNKQVEQYRDQYLDIQDYFFTVSNFKKKIVQALQNLSVDFHLPLVFHQSQKSQQPQKPRKQQQNKIHQSESHQKIDRTVTINNQNKNTKITYVQEKGQHKKPGPKPKQKKKSYSNKQMLYIPQAPDEDEQATDTGQQIKPLKSNKIQQKKERKPRNSKRQVYCNKSDKNEEDSFQMNLKALQKKDRSASSGLNKSNKSLQKRKNTPQAQKQVGQRQSKSQEHKNGQKNDEEQFIMIRPQQFVTYYQHQSNTFNARKIFREDLIQSRLANVKSSYWFYGHYVYRYPKFINTEYFENPIVQTFQANYKDLKFKKSILYPKAKSHKHFVKSIFEQQQRLIKENHKFHEYNNKKKSIQFNQDHQKLLKMVKQVNKIKRENLQFYLNYSRKYGRITQVSIRLYPLVKKVYGQFTLKELTKITQRLLYYLANNQSHVQQIETNVFNKKLRDIHDMINLRIDNFTSEKIHELFMSILFEIMHAINTSDRSLDSFYNLYYKNIPPHMQSMVLFYMFQIQRKRPLKYEILFRKLFLNRLQAKEIYNLLKFMIKDVKLSSIELNNMYYNIYELLSQRCGMMIQTVQQLLCRQIIPIVKYESDRHQSQHLKKQRHKHLITLKNKLYQSLSTMIDLINVWLCLSYSSMNYEPNLPSKNLFPMRKIPLVYFCNTCGSIQTLQVSTKKPVRLQSSICRFCQTYLMDRFELHCENLYWSHFDNTQEIKMRVRQSRQVIYDVLGEHQWNVKRLPLFEYQQKIQGGYNMLMELHDDDQKRKEPKKPKKSQKSEEELIQEDNEQFCLNSCQLLTCFYEDLAVTIADALSY